MTLETENLFALGSFISNTDTVEVVNLASTDIGIDVGGCSGSLGTFGTAGSLCGCAGTFGSLGSYGCSAA